MAVVDFLQTICANNIEKYKKNNFKVLIESLAKEILSKNKFSSMSTSFLYYFHFVEFLNYALNQQ